MVAYTLGLWIVSFDAVFPSSLGVLTCNSFGLIRLFLLLHRSSSSIALGVCR